MVMINNVDQVMALVRGQLNRMARDKKVASGKKAARAEQTRATRETRLQALGNLSDLPDEEFGRTLVGALLSREFGEEVAQDPRFQPIVEQTWLIMREDGALRAAMRDIRGTLQAARGPGDV